MWQGMEETDFMRDKRDGWTQEQQGQEVSRQTATGSPGRIDHWPRFWRLRNSIWSVHPNVIKMRNTIARRRECLLWHMVWDIFLLWEHFL